MDFVLSYFVITSTHFVITVASCNKTVAFCDAQPDVFCNKLFSHFVINYLSDFVIISVAYYNKVSL